MSNDPSVMAARDDWRSLYLNEWVGPGQCENKNLAGTARCTNAAEYVITVRDTNGYICGECVGGCVRSSAKIGPVTVERLPR